MDKWFFLVVSNDIDPELYTLTEQNGKVLLWRTEDQAMKWAKTEVRLPKGHGLHTVRMPTTVLKMEQAGNPRVLREKRNG